MLLSVLIGSIAGNWRRDPRNLMGIFIAACSIMVLVTRKPVTHASPLGRAHIEPVNPGEIGCDRPEHPSGCERARYVT